ncbi:MAG TPA: alpha/beta hydrolase, partial [Armatimonadota bacterium]
MPRIQVDNLIVDYTDAGSGVPIVFIPGVTEFKEAFTFQYRGLQDNYRVISYDVRRGLKRMTDYTLDLLVADLRNFLRTMDLDSAVICGHSFGGLIAMQFALQYPQETKALILTSSFPAPPAGVPLDRLTGWISSGGHPLHSSLGTMFKLHMSRLLGRKSSGAINMEHQVAAVRAVAHQAEQVAPTTIAQRTKIIAKTDFRAALSEINSPTLIVAGGKDRSFFLSSAQQLYQGIPDSTLEVIEGSGHFCFLTRH